MLPQKKSQLRRNACYRQQLLQNMPDSATSVVDPDTEYRFSCNNRHSPAASNSVSGTTRAMGSE